MNKLNKHQVDSIRWFLYNNYPQVQIAEKFCVSKHTIAKIKTKENHSNHISSFEIEHIDHFTVNQEELYGFFLRNQKEIKYLFPEFPKQRRRNKETKK